MTCCCGWKNLKGLVNRCDFRRHVNSGNDLATCRDANEDHGLSYEGGCAANEGAAFVDPAQQPGSTCWIVTNFADPEAVTGVGGADTTPPPPPPTPSASTTTPACTDIWLDCDERKRRVPAHKHFCNRKIPKKKCRRTCRYCGWAPAEEGTCGDRWRDCDVRLARAKRKGKGEKFCKNWKKAKANCVATCANEPCANASAV